MVSVEFNVKSGGQDLKYFSLKTANGSLKIRFYNLSEV